MSEDMERHRESSKKLLAAAPMMVISIIIVAVILPMSMVIGTALLEVLQSARIKMNPNLDDGYVIAEFSDPAHDLLREVPHGEKFSGSDKALDIRKFSVKKVRFHPLSGVGIAPRLNLVFSFDTEFPNPHHSEHKFSLPVIHVYIDAPGKSSPKKTSDKTADIDFAGDGWDYQVIIDGMHEQARIFDVHGNLLDKSLGIYINYERENTGRRRKGRIKSTSITAGLPMEMLGDPAQGEWSYYVVVGLADLGNPSMMMPPENEDQPQIFDCVQPRGSPPLKMDL